MTRALWRALAALVVMAAPGALPGRALGQETRPVTLTYLNAPEAGAPLLHPPTLGLAIGGQVHRAVMDTGSTGIVMSASSIGGIEQLEVLGAGSITYSSSGRVMQGRYVKTPVTIVGGNGATLTTRPLPVLAVDTMDCLASARNCQPDSAPRGIAMLGIGFAREGDHQPAGTPDKNPFLNLPAMGTPGQPGALGRGYIVRRRDVQVGLHPHDRLEQFDRQVLSPDAARPDWGPPKACVSLAGRTPAACGTLLLDTGVSIMYLSTPPDQFEGLEQMDARGEPVLADGTEVAIEPPPGARVPAYRFVVGAPGNFLAPDRVILVGRGRRPPFVNVTVRALNGFDYAYDADTGTVGFRPLPVR